MGRGRTPGGMPPSRVHSSRVRSPSGAQRSKAPPEPRASAVGTDRGARASRSSRPGVGAVALPLLQQGPHLLLPGALHGHEAHPQALLALGGEVPAGGVGVGAAHHQAVPPGVAQVGDGGVVAALVGDHRREELRRVVGLEPGALEAHLGVAGGVGLAEGVAPEGAHHVPHLVHHRLRDALAAAAVPELRLEQGQLAGAVVLAQDLAQLVRLRVAPAGHGHAHPHHVLLVDQHPVALRQQRRPAPGGWGRRPPRRGSA